ncbi:AIPR family protein [Microtetraspora malaysiensis]|uniref:AIPR family protein n=1 Tax=Microtetraspora malaysiensis TaxID=161358 RepID=UPI003D942688
MNPLIKGLFKKFRETEELSALEEADAFELFSATLILPDELMSQSEKTDFLLDAGSIGIDIIALEINGQLARDTDDVREICGQASQIDVSLYLIQAKQSASISSVDILGFGDTAKKFLCNEGGFSNYPRLEELASAFALVFEDFATSLRHPPTVYLSFVTTASKGSVEDPVVRDRAASVEGQIANLGFLGRVFVNVYGADELHEAWSKKNHANEVEIQLEKQVNLPKMPGVDQAILGVVSVSELLKLVQGTDGALDERVFYDNVRGFKGEDNPVNRQILSTLSTHERDLLPVLNNGVTVVASSYSPKPGDAVAISGFQIVNGCQTSHCLYLSRDMLGDQIVSVYVPIRLVITGDEDVATRIIRATNSQTEVHENDLVALTKFQKKLEDFYTLDTPEVNLTYERRSGQFYSAAVTKRRVVTISDQMRAISAVFLDSPHAAARYPARLYAEVGKSIFQEEHKLLPYVASAYAAYRIENAFRAGLDPVYKPARYHILMAYKYQVLNGPSAALNARKCETQSETLISALKQPDQVDLFRSAAESVMAVAEGRFPTRDRLKRERFTQELIAYLMQRIENS